MKRAIKDIIIAVGRAVATPWRRHKQHKYATTKPTGKTWEVANDQFLSIVTQAMRNTGDTATINVKGYSMRPFLEHLRDRVVLKSVQPDELKLHDVVLAEISSGVYVLHRIIGIDSDRLTLMGDGNLRGTESCERKDVCGLAIRFLRPNGHSTDTSDSGYQRRVRLWLKLLPVRRALLFFYKLTL